MMAALPLAVSDMHVTCDAAQQLIQPHSRVHHAALQALPPLERRQEVLARLHVLQLDILAVRQQHCESTAEGPSVAALRASCW